MLKHHIVNLRYIVDNYHFDAAIDYTGILGMTSENEISIELYNLDVDWDVKRICQTKENFKNNKGLKGNINTDSNSFVDFDFIVEKTKEWIEVMKNIEIIKVN